MIKEKYRPRKSTRSCYLILQNPKTTDQLNYGINENTSNYYQPYILFHIYMSMRQPPTKQQNLNLVTNTAFMFHGCHDGRHLSGDIPSTCRVNMKKTVFKLTDKTQRYGSSFCVTCKFTVKETFHQSSFFIKRS